jgi:S-formylglutathione hydrolase FrmB
MKHKVATVSITLALAFATTAQQPLPNASAPSRPAVIERIAPRLRTYEFKSNVLDRKTRFQVLLPASYSTRRNIGRSYPVLYLLHGLTGKYDNWTQRTAIEKYSVKYQLIIVMPDGGDSWYTDSVTVAADRYETYVISELIPVIDRAFRTISEKQSRAIAGLSMGGYGAVKFGLKHPEMFSLVGSFSGALDAPLRGQDQKSWRPSIMTVFGSENSPARATNDVYALANQLSDERIKILPYFYISCGTEDTVNFKRNEEFADLLVAKKIPHEYRHFPGAHSWTVWDSEIQEFLRLARAKLKLTVRSVPKNI